MSLNGSTDPLSFPEAEPRIPPRPRIRTACIMTKQDPTSPAPTSSDRDAVREEALVALHRALASRPFRPLLLLGSRPNARRTFLEDFAREGESLGFLVSRIDARETDFLGRLLGERKRILQTLGNECRRPSEMPYDVETGGPVAELMLPDLLEEAGESVRAAGKGWLLTVNDMHRLPKKELAALIAGLHRIAKRNLPVVLLGAGLPKLARLSGDAMPYAERLFLFRPLLGNASAPNKKKELVR